jgi:hypothetical protein
LRWAEEQSKNLVVPLSDHAFIEFLKLSTEESWYPKTILENTGVTVEETEEWTAGKIKSPLSTRQSRMDRSAAEDFLQIVLNRGFASDPEALRFAPHMGTFPRVGSLGEVLTLLLQPTSARFLIRAKPSDQSIYEALLTIDRSDTTSFPEPKPLEGFSPTVQNAVREYLTRSRARTRSSRTFTHVMEEPTEFLAGPNPPILIRVYSLSRDAYVAHNPETLFSDVVTPWVLSLSMGQGDRFKANPTHFSPARERTVGIIIYMADQPISNSLNIELESARDGNTITREQLFEKHTDLFGRM